MRWIVLFLLIISLFLLWRKGPEESRDGRAVVKSERRILDAEWRGKPEGEMTIGEMERYASGLSDGELWREIYELSQRWLTENAELNRPNPPRLVIILGRELGKRDGIDGLGRVESYFEDLELNEEPETVFDENLYTLGSQMEVAVFGGWIERKPHDAIREFLSWWKDYENISFAGYQVRDEDVYRSEMMGRALGGIASVDPDSAFDYLKTARKDLPWMNYKMIYDFIAGVSLESRDHWSMRASEEWPHLKEFWNISPSTAKDFLVENPDIADWEVRQFVGQLEEGVLRQLVMNEGIKLGHRAGLLASLVEESRLPMDEILAYPDKVQAYALWYLIDLAAAVSSRSPIGPIAGEEISREQNWERWRDQAKVVIAASDLTDGERKEILESLQRQDAWVHGKVLEEDAEK